jgi:hypothetical protein
MRKGEFVRENKSAPADVTISLYRLSTLRSCRCCKPANVTIGLFPFADVTIGLFPFADVTTGLLAFTS